VDNMAKVQFQMVVSKVATNAEWVGKVFDGWESYEGEFKGVKELKKRQWSIWVDQPMDLGKDDVIEVTGNLITKSTGEQKEWNGITWFPVIHSVQHAQVRVISKGSPEASKTNVAATNGWNTPAPTHDPSNPPF
jgi:hypothetical protein